MTEKLSVEDRFEIAYKFLEFFSGHSIFVSKFDPPTENGYELEEVDKKPWHYHKKLKDCVQNLINSNDPSDARGIFFCVNELDKSKDPDHKRTNKMWVRSRAIWCEDDNIIESDNPNDFRTDWPIIPNLVVNTSRGKYHYYWCTSIDNSSEWSSVQERLVQDYGSDNSAKDLARILRLPGFYHLKDPENPHLVKYFELRKTPYSWEEIKKAFPPVDFKEEGYNPKIDKAKKERRFERTDPVLELLIELGYIKEQIEHGTYDMTCPWINEHTNQEDSGTRFFQAFFNGHDQPNFKCHHAHCEHRNINDLLYKIKFRDKVTLPARIREENKVTAINRPIFPNDFMLDWPEPWPLIWENWKKVPRELSQPLLTPTILSLHGYILNSKYTTEWGRRPNLYQLNLAESTAHKDTNSKDVLRSFSEIMTENEFYNTFFDIDLFNSDSNITSDTSFLQILEKNNGSFYWVNTEATRVFQQLNGSGVSNSAVMGLSDKIIEVVDGHGITAKAKVNNKITGCTDPNIQIVFFAQPETIEKYITEDIIDSGFLGRAIITLDEKQNKKPNMFIRKTSLNKNIDERLLTFYASRTIGNVVKNVRPLFPDDNGMKELADWAEEFINPILENNTIYESPMWKMLSRIGNTAEQLYTIILGICQEWDMYHEREPRESKDVSPKCMFPILEFWTQSKAYVVNEYISLDSDPIAKAIERLLLKYLREDIKLDKEYTRILREKGLVPRSILMRSMRNQSRLRRQMHATQSMFVSKVNLILDTLIENEILREVILAKNDRLLKGKRTKFIGFCI